VRRGDPGEDLGFEDRVWKDVMAIDRALESADAYAHEGQVGVGKARPFRDWAASLATS
jgi:hypothetical protein